ncbi:MAG: hypothetical protein AAFR41_11210 [Pseudomonadota bacterium]
MRTTARMALLVSTGVLGLVCQACSTHSSLANSTDYLSPMAVSELSDGQRMATSMTFGVQSDLLENGSAVHARASSILAPRAPVAIDAVALAGGELDVVDRFAITAPRSPAEAAITGLNWSSADGVLLFQGDRNLNSYLRPQTGTAQNFTAEIAFAAPSTSTGFGFDLSLSPRVAVVDDGRFATRRVGAEVRVGQNFDQRGKQVDVGSWYIFAGQDGEALVWEAGDHGFSNITGAMALRDKVTVGDVQAGVALHRGLGELSLSYIHREIEWSDRNGGASTNEDFAGISFTMRR